MPTRKSKSGKSRSKPSSRSTTLKLLEKAKKRHEEIKEPELAAVVNEETYDISTELDSKFTQKFIENEERIKIALSKSGRHPIIKEKAQEFIDRQISPIRRQAAKDLIDNTHYITMSEIFHIIEELILKTYARIDLRKEIYLYCGKNNKSFYFFACISLYFINKHKLKMPHFVTEISINLLLEIEDCPLIIVDDASYSGAQLSNLLNDLFYGVVIEEKKPPSNIYVLLASVNDQSLGRLSKVPNSKSQRMGYITFIDSPFQIMYLDEYKYKSLVREVGIERYFYINLYFNVFLSKDTNIALYLDHKVADMTSTYKNVYVYGPIVPPNYDINEIHEFYVDPVYLHYNFDKNINRELYEDFLRENPTFLKENPRYANIPLTFTSTDESYKSIIRSIPSFLIDKALTLDIQDIEYSLNNNEEIQLEFCPFIKGCNKSTKLKEIIKNPLVLNSKYLFFMFDLTAQSLNDFSEDMYTQTRKETRQVIKLLDSHRCPENWYKNGILQLI